MLEKGVSLRRQLLTASLLPLCLVSACSVQPAGSPYSAKFQLAPLVTPAGVAVQPAEQKPKGTETLVVNISQFLSKFRRVLAVPAVVNKVIITVTASDGTVFTEILDLAKLTAGHTSVTFNGLVPGETTIVIEAYDATDKVIGSSRDTARITPGVIAQKDMGLSLGPTQQRLGGSGGGGSSTPGVGGVTLDLTLTELSGQHTMLQTPLTDPALTLFAGGTYGSADGPAASAGLAGLGPVALTASGEVYFVDQWHSVLRKVDANGWVSTLARIWGHVTPNPVTDIVADDAGHVYYVEGNRNHVGLVNLALPPADPQFITTVAGSDVSGSVDGTQAVATFTAPHQVVLGPDGKLYVADGARIRVIDLPAGPAAANYVTTLAGGGDGTTADGPNATAQVGTVQALAVAADGTVYFIDGKRLRKVAPSVAKTDAGYITTVVDGDRGAYVDGPAGAAGFLGPRELAIDGQGRLYMTDANAVRLVDLTRPPTDGFFVSTLAGRPLGLGTNEPLGWGTRLAVAPDGSLVLTDENRHTLWRGTPW